MSGHVRGRSIGAGDEGQALRLAPLNEGQQCRAWIAMVLGVYLFQGGMHSYVCVCGGGQRQAQGGMQLCKAWGGASPPPGW